MPAKLSYCWRLLGTGIGFVSFGIGGLVLGCLVAPSIFLLVKHPEKRAAAFRRAIHYCFRLHIGTLIFLGVLTYEVHDRAKLAQPGLLLIANHPTLLDVVFLGGFVKDAVCVVKHSLFTNPYLGFVVRAANYISNEDPEASIDACVACLNAGITTIIFPEGTRTNAAHRLQRGAAYVAMRSQLPLTPVSIRCEPATLEKEQKWYEIPDRKVHYVFRVEQEIVITDNEVATTQALTARRATEKIRLKLFGNTINGRA